MRWTFLVIPAAAVVLVACSAGSDSPSTDLPFVLPDLVAPTDASRDAPKPDDPGVDATRPDGEADGTQDPGVTDAPTDPGTDPGAQDPDIPTVSDPGVDPGQADTGPLCGGQVCGSGSICMNGTCEPCIFAEACGTGCIACQAPTPHCYEGRCVNCRTDSDCGEGQWCDAQQCAACGDSDPAHCGNLCETCEGQTPACVSGRCECTPLSCGSLTCLDGTCNDCSTPEACGATCEPCPAATPLCHMGACVACVLDDDCDAGQWCDGGTCQDCGLDPLHCGAACEACTPWEPTCTEQGCICTPESCGSGRRCVDGECEGCDTPAACGPNCVPCAAPTPLCRAGQACVQCTRDADCPTTQYCTGSWTCADRCFGALGCVSDNVPDGRKCSTAKVVGRKVAVAGIRIAGDTTDHGNNDNLPSIGGPDCWDGQVDDFYRVFLMTGDRLAVTATPLSSTYQLSLKLYRGTVCKDNWKADFITCQWKGGDNKPQSFVHIAAADGWHTIVVDGASAFDEERDWGPYNLDIKLDCVGPLCCCN